MNCLYLSENLDIIWNKSLNIIVTVEVEIWIFYLYIVQFKVHTIIVFL